MATDAVREKADLSDLAAALLLAITMSKQCRREEPAPQKPLQSGPEIRYTNQTNNNSNEQRACL